MKVIIYIYFALIFVTSCTATGAPTSNFTKVAPDKDVPSKYQLRRNFYNLGEILVVYSAVDEKIKNNYQSLLQEIVDKTSGTQNRNINILFKEASTVSEEEIKNKVLFLVGSPDSNPLLKRLAVNIPIEFEATGLRFNGTEFKEKDDLVTISFYPNPENTNLPFLLITGNDEANIQNFFQSEYDNDRFLNQRMDFEIYRDQSKVIVGGFDRSWNINEASYFDYSVGKDTLFSTKNFDFISHQNAIPLDQAKALSETMEQTVNRISQFVKSNKALPKIGFHVYRSAEDKGLLKGNTKQAHVKFSKNEAYTIYNEKYENNYLQKENLLVLRHLLGAPKTKWLENAFAIYFTKQWQREGYLYWTARLAESDVPLSVQSLFDKDFMKFESPLIRDCMSSTLVSFLIKEWGQDVFLKKYADWDPKEIELKKLEKKWQNYLVQVVKDKPRKERPQKDSPYLKGFNFAHEGYSIYNGYLSRMASASLKKQADLGANSIAIVPYSYMRNIDKPTPIPISSRAGSENDQGVIYSAHEAKKLGMSSMLKPQIWFNSSWPGAVEMKSREDWDSFFEYYYRWIRHYALLAEIHDIEMLCIGVEFAQATLQNESEWRTIFKDIKKLYKGKVTYAANWGYEFEQIKFWDELDFIGLNCYYPLSKNDDPSDKELKANFEVIKEKIEKVYNEFEKPIVFTEIGFRSTPAPWKNPHAEDGKTFNGDDQARCYEVIFEGIKDEPWCNGILWWKYPSYLEYGGMENNSFTPNNKKAEAVVKKWFSK